MPSYNTYITAFYDAFMGDEKNIILPLKQLLKKHALNPKKVLEIGCGTGSVLRSFPKKTKLYGLDISKGMLQQAKKKVPDGTFYHADMANFSLGESFDLIICMFDAINHVLSWQDWKKTFRNVSLHLEKDGYFIFDINSLDRLKYLTRLGVYFGYPYGDSIVLTRNNPTVKKNIFSISFKFFLKKKSNTYSVVDEEVKEVGFPVDMVRKGLEAYFTIIEQFDLIVEKSNPHSKRIFFVCKKNKKRRYCFCNIFFKTLLRVFMVVLFVPYDLTFL